MKTTLLPCAVAKGLIRTYTTGVKKIFWKPVKKRQMGDTMREANTNEVKEIRQENLHLKQLVVDLVLKYSVLKKDHMY